MISQGVEKILVVTALCDMHALEKNEHNKHSSYRDHRRVRKGMRRGERAVAGRALRGRLLCRPVLRRTDSVNVGKG